MKNVFLFLALTILTSCEPDGYHDLVKGHNAITALVNQNHEMINLINEQNKTFVTKIEAHDDTYYNLGKFTTNNSRKIAANLEYFTKLASIVDSLKSENEQLKDYLKLYAANINDLAKKVNALEAKVK